MLRSYTTNTYHFVNGHCFKHLPLTLPKVFTGVISPHSQLRLMMSTILRMKTSDYELSTTRVSHCNGEKNKYFCAHKYHNIDEG